jgi:hypothetical protein
MLNYAKEQVVHAVDDQEASRVPVGQAKQFGPSHSGFLEYLVTLYF